MATFLSCDPDASHNVSVKLTLYCTEFHQQFELHSLVLVFLIDCCRQSLIFPLELSVCESDCVFQSGFSCSVPRRRGRRRAMRRRKKKRRKRGNE